MLVRLNTNMTVESNPVNSRMLSPIPTYSDNCPARAGDKSRCDLTVTKDETVTATFG